MKRPAHSTYSGPRAEAFGLKRLENWADDVTAIAGKREKEGRKVCGMRKEPLRQPGPRKSPCESKSRNSFCIREE